MKFIIACPQVKKAFFILFESSPLGVGSFISGTTFCFVWSAYFCKISSSVTGGRSFVGGGALFSASWKVDFNSFCKTKKKISSLLIKNRI